MNTKIMVIVVVGVLVVGGGLFYFNTRFEKNDSRSNFTQMDQERRLGTTTDAMRGRQGAPTSTGGMPGRPGMVEDRTVGEIISKNDTSITVKLADGRSQIILISSSTRINKMISGSITTGLITDLVVGENVMVIGEANAAGVITAESIQLLGDLTLPQPPR